MASYMPTVLDDVNPLKLKQNMFLQTFFDTVFYALLETSMRHNFNPLIIHENQAYAKRKIVALDLRKRCCSVLFFFPIKEEIKISIYQLVIHTLKEDTGSGEDVLFFGRLKSYLRQRCIMRHVSNKLYEYITSFFAK